MKGGKHFNADWKKNNKQAWPSCPETSLNTTLDPEEHLDCMKEIMSYFETRPFWDLFCPWWSFDFPANQLCKYTFKSIKAWLRDQSWNALKLPVSLNFLAFLLQFEKRSSNMETKDYQWSRSFYKLLYKLLKYTFTGNIYCMLQRVELHKKNVVGFRNS